ncbi:MAG: putative septum site-determining protein minC [uncultured bacterium]|nr:MAG: putative septum site-determining protein minC [uncultured bacterium]
MSATVTPDRQACFQFKTTFAPCSILQMIHYDLDALKIQLSEATARAPTFFLGAPVIIDLEKINTAGSLNFSKLKEILLTNHLVPIGVRNGNTEQMTAAITEGLPMLTVGKLTQGEPVSIKEIKVSQQAKLVTNPIRSGMQVYAKETDLIVAASVSAGAELLADGHIHVYGPLRGRALAGVQGNKDARIFCRSLSAELISIAGYYLTKEDMQALPESHGMIQIYLEQEQVRIETIS